jgi:hypothetical protein
MNVGVYKNTKEGQEGLVTFLERSGIMKARIPASLFTKTFGAVP